MAVPHIDLSRKFSERFSLPALVVVGFNAREEVDCFVGMISSSLTEILHVHPTTIYRLVKRGVLPGFKIGANWRINRASLDVWLSGGSPPQFTPRT